MCVSEPPTLDHKMSAFSVFFILFSVTVGKLCPFESWIFSKVKSFEKKLPLAEEHCCLQQAIHGSGQTMHTHQCRRCISSEWEMLVYSNLWPGHTMHTLWQQAMPTRMEMNSLQSKWEGHSIGTDNAHFSGEALYCVCSKQCIHQWWWLRVREALTAVQQASDQVR